MKREELANKFCELTCPNPEDHNKKPHPCEYVALTVERLLAQEREPTECGHPKSCLSPITVEYRDGTVEDAQECSFCVQLKSEREKVREMCAHYLEVEADRDTIVEDELKPLGQTILKTAALHLRLLDLTAPSSTEEGGDA